MSDIFISCARPNERQAQQAGDALRAAGYDSIRDDPRFIELLAKLKVRAAAEGVGRSYALVSDE